MQIVERIINIDKIAWMERQQETNVRERLNIMFVGGERLSLWGKPITDLLEILSRSKAVPNNFVTIGRRCTHYN